MRNEKDEAPILFREKLEIFVHIMKFVRVIERRRVGVKAPYAE